MSTRALRARPARARGERVRGALTNPLYRGGYALVVNTAGTTVIGVAYWAVAAHLYGQQALGRSSALVSALILVSSIATLNLGSTLPRFLPQANRRAGRLIRYSYAVTSAAALVVGLGFVLIMPLLNAHWQFLRGSADLAVAFVAACVLWGVFALEDSALTGLRRAAVVPVENMVYGVVKLVLLIAIASLLPANGIFLSWVVPLALIVPAVNWLIFGRYLKPADPIGQGATVRAREVVRYAAVDYVGGLFGQFYNNLLPLLVLSVLGADANGTFYIAWTIASGLALVTTNFATSMLVEGAAAPERLAELTRGVLLRCALITVPAMALLIFAAHPILSVYGAKDADQAAPLLSLLAIGIFPRSLVVVTFSLDRLARRVGRVTLTNLALTVLVLGGSWILLDRIGLNGVALAWGGANLVVALVRLPTLVGAIRRPQAAVTGNARRGIHRRPAGRHRAGTTTS